jgi:hypothetical protein
MSVGLAITVGAALASTLLRGMGSWSWPGRYIAPWKYYELGQRVARCKAGAHLISAKARGCRDLWHTGTRLHAEHVGLKNKALRMKKKFTVGRYAEWLLEGVEPPGMFHLWGIGKNRDDDPEDPHWGFIRLGVLTWRARWDDACRSILGETWEMFLQRTNLPRWEVMMGSGGKMSGTASSMVKLIRKKHAKQLGQLKAAFVKLTPRRVRKRKEAEKLLRDLSQEATSRAQDEIEKQMWFGPPAPWIIDQACKHFEKYGPRAVMRYLAVRPDVTARSLQRHAPDALQDPLLIALFGGSLMPSGRRN